MTDKLVEKLFTQLLEQNSDKWLTQEEIINALPSLKYNETSHDKCPKLWSLVNKLNHSEDYDKIILINNCSYKIASKEEVDTWTSDYMNKRIVPMLKRYHNIRKKADLNDTFNIFRQEFIETFINDWI